MQRLNIGCGVIQPPEWRNLDKVDHGQEFVADVLEGLPFPDDFADMAVCNHVLSDWTFHELPHALSELYRVLKPGGVLRVLVPDLLAAFHHYQNDDGYWFPQGDDLTALDERFVTFVTWFGTVGSVFTPQYLRLLLSRAGFVPGATLRPGFTNSKLPEITSLDGDRTTALIMEGVRS